MSAGLELTAEQLDVVAEYANRIPEAQWDRYVAYQVDQDGEPRTCATVFGWVARDDGRSDFVTLRWDWMERQAFPEYVTSSAWLSPQLGGRLYRDQDWYVSSEHVDCRRVEDTFGDRIASAVRIDKTAATRDQGEKS